MQYYKVFELGMWRVYAFEDGEDVMDYMPTGAIRVKDDEASEIAAQAPSEEYKASMEASRATLGSGNMPRYPPKDVKEAIGAICVNSSYIEVALRTIIWQAAGINAEVGMVFTGGKLGVQDLTEMLTLILKQRYPALHEKSAPLLKHLKGLNESRGKYVHGVWSPGTTGQMLVGKPFLKRSHEQGQFELVTLNQLHDIAEGYMQVETSLMHEVLGPLIPES